ncbi:MAG: hypothetical protein Q3962_05780 [Corynebacterium sp.]|nr:hypothetical protein [Corynebacterium sp.]
MNSKGNISRGLGRMAIASALALSTTAGVVVAPQMAQIAHADDSTTKSYYSADSSGFGESTLYVTKNSDGTYDLKLIFKNLTKIPLINPKLTISGITYDASKATILIGDARYSQYAPVYNPYSNLSDGRYPFTLASGDGSAIINNQVTTSLGIYASGQSGTRLIVGALPDGSTGANSQSALLAQVEVDIPNATIDSSANPVLSFSATPGVPLTSSKWNTTNGDSQGSDLWNAMHDVETYSTLPAKNIWSLMNIQYYSTNTESVQSKLATVVNTTLIPTVNKVSAAGNPRVSSVTTNKSGENVITALVDSSTDPYANLSNLREAQRSYYQTNAASDSTAASTATAINTVMGGSSDSTANSTKVNDVDAKAANAYIDTLKSNASSSDQTALQTIEDALTAKVTAGTATALDVYKAIAKAEIQTNSNLSDAQKKALEDQIDAAADGAAVKDILDAADKLTDEDTKTNTADDNTKAVAADVISGLDNLVDGQKSSYEDAVKADGLTNEQVKEILDHATNQDAVQGGDDSAAYTQATNDADKAAAKSGVQGILTTDGTTPKDGVRADKVTELENEAASAATALDVAKAIAKAEIEANTDLTDAQKDSLEQQIADASKPSEIQNILDSADALSGNSKDSEAASDAVKAVAEAQIGAMDNLTDGQKTSYKAAIAADGVTVGTVKAIVAAADNIDKVMGAESDGKADTATIQQDKDAAKAGVLGLLTTDGTTPKTGVRADKLTEIENEAANAATALDVAKAIAKAKIEANTNLSDAQKDALEKQIDDATTAEQVKNIVDAADKLTDEDTKTNTADDNTKAVAADVISGLDNLVDGQKSSYEDAVKADGLTNEQVKEILDHATNQDAVQGGDDSAAYTQATNDADKDAAKAGVQGILTTDGTTPKDGVRADKVTELENEAANAATALDVAKAIAKAEIEANSKLSDEQKDELQQQIDDATKPSEVKSIVDAASDLTDDSKKDETASQGTKDVASKSIDDMTNLVDGQKSSYKDAISAADTTNGDVAQILENASNIDKVQGGDDSADASKATSQTDKDAAKAGVQGILTTDGTTPKDGVRADKVTELENEAANAATALDVAKAIAKAEIEANTDLTDAQKDANQKAIDEATTPSAVKDIIDNPSKDAGESTDTSGTADSRTDYQNKADTIIDNLPNLTDDQKKDYKDRVAGTTNPSEILTIVKEAAVESINSSGMTDDQKQSATDKVNDGDDIDSVDTVVKQYSNLDAALERAKRLLDEVTSVRNGDNYTKASDDLKNAYDEAIETLKDNYDKAKAAVDAGTDSPVTAADLTEYSDKVEAARDALTPASSNSGSSLSSGPAWWVWLLGVLGLTGGVLGWGYVHDADFRAVVDTAIANFQHAVDDARANVERALGIRQ